MDIVKKTSQQLLSIINDIIDISKIETNQVKVNLGNTNLSALMNKVKAVLDPQATLKKLELKLTVEVPDEYCNVVTDEAKLTQVITNLINNALKFTVKGYIEFGVSKEDNLLKFYVKDTGIGITPENQLLVFERFRQVETDLTRHFGGSGLGLSISKAFVEVLGGRIWVESEFGKGSTFVFTIPYFSSNLSYVGGQSMMQSSKNNLIGVVILVAEDEDVNFLYLKELMDESGATIIRAKNGKEAVDIGTADSRISMLSDGTYNSLSGTSVYRDFVELPSQIMENWALQKQWLDLFAVNYKTGEKIPAALVQKIIESKNYLSGYASVRQLSFGIVDMSWHSITAPFNGDVLAFEQKAMPHSVGSTGLPNLSRFSLTKNALAFITLS